MLGLAGYNAMNFASTGNQESKLIPMIVDINNNDDELLYCPFSTSVKKYNGSCNDIDNACSKLCAPDKVKDMNVKVFDLMPWVNETRFLTCHKSYTCKCKLDWSDCNDRLSLILTNIGVNVKNWLIEVLLKKFLRGMLLCVNVN